MQLAPNSTVSSLTSNARILFTQSVPMHRDGGGSVTSQRRALVVDDDAGIRILVTRILGRYGFIVDSARDGGEAIEQILAHDYSVIALDLMMPRIDGFAVVKYLASHLPQKLPHVIVMTAFGSSALPKVCPPVVHFIEKPFDIDRFIAEAAECLTA